MTWCQFRAAEKDLAGAWEWLRWALARDPDHDEAVNMQGILLHTEGRFDEAIAVFERAEALGNRAAASNRGNSLLDLGRMDEALKAQETAVERDPANAGAQYNLALTQLRLGDWKQGWAGYEARWRFREVHRKPRVFRQPRWNGEELNGQRILLHAEQGLGDTIQFCRYAALVAARGGVPILQVQPAAERLMRSLRRGARRTGGDGGAGSGAAVRLGVPADEFAGGLRNNGRDGSLAGRLPGGGPGIGAGEAGGVSGNWAGAARGAGLGGQSAVQGGLSAVDTTGDAAAAAAHCGFHVDIAAERRSGGAVGPAAG